MTCLVVSYPPQRVPNEHLACLESTTDLVDEGCEEIGLTTRFGGKTKSLTIVKRHPIRASRGLNARRLDSVPKLGRVELLRLEPLAPSSGLREVEGFGENRSGRRSLDVPSMSYPQDYGTKEEDESGKEVCDVRSSVFRSRAVF